MTNFAEIRFKGTRRDYYSCRGVEVEPGAWVVVEADRGEDLGEVTAMGSIAERKCSAAAGGCPTPNPEKRVLRLAESFELGRVAELRSDEERVRGEAGTLVARHRLKMKVTEAEWQFDRKKLIIYFTAERRVDFRELVRDLARTFRTRIELKQIGVRDEAKRIGGVGVCGRRLCCTTFLRKFEPVVTQYAKDQNLALNPTKLSGGCGRLMCCLRYEQLHYAKILQSFPEPGTTIKTQKGTGVILSLIHI